MFSGPVSALLGTPPKECRKKDAVPADDSMAVLQVILPEGMAADSIHSAAGLQILAGELLVTERTVEQVRLAKVCARRCDELDA